MQQGGDGSKHGTGGIGSLWEHPRHERTMVETSTCMRSASTCLPGEKLLACTLHEGYKHTQCGITLASVEEETHIPHQWAEQAPQHRRWAGGVIPLGFGGGCVSVDGVNLSRSPLKCGI